MKSSAITAIIVGLILLGLQARSEIFSRYQLEKQYTQLWKLADKSSTIQAKEKYIREFVDALERGYARGEFSGHNAIFLQTPNNNFEANLVALKSLSRRLAEIQEMKPSSFEYNTAIQQITAQEQGEANAMLDVFRGCYELANYVLVWNWIGGTILALATVLIFVGGFIWMEES